MSEVDHSSESAAQTEVLDQAARAISEAVAQATETTETTVSEYPKNEEEKLNVAMAAVWPPRELAGFTELLEMALDLVARFFPKEEFIDLFRSELRRLGKWAESDAQLLAEVTFTSAVQYHANRSEDLQWQKRLDHIFNGEYPKKSRERWCNGVLSGFRYEKVVVFSDRPYTFRVQQVDPIPMPRDLLASTIAPALFNIEPNGKNDTKLVPTADVQRFCFGDKKAVPKSALHEEVVYNRPVYGVIAGWEKHKPRRLPRKVVTVDLTSSHAKSEIVREFVDDLRTAFAWPEDKQAGTSSLATYVGYLVQPMLSHQCLGQMPAYAFLGPTKSGKGFLSNALPSLIYHRNADPTIVTKRLPKGTYEFEVLMESARNALFLAFDEVKNATDEELKMIDAFCTQTEVQVRKFRVGYYQLPNLYTVSLTAVHRTFTDESYGRLAVIQLTESRPERIAEFYQKWRFQGAELLRGLFEAVAGVDIDFNAIPKIPDRRPGFGLMSYVVERAIGIKPDYSVESSNNDILDDLCLMHEGQKTPKPLKGGWARYSPRNFTDFVQETHEIRWKKANAIAAINTALGYTSTRKHPSYKLTGYPAESGRHYHIELREEGQSNKRTFIYIMEMNPKDDQPEHPSLLGKDATSLPKGIEAPTGSPECFANETVFVPQDKRTPEVGAKCTLCPVDFHCEVAIQKKQTQRSVASIG